MHDGHCKTSCIVVDNLICRDVSLAQSLDEGSLLKGEARNESRVDSSYQIGSRVLITGIDKYASGSIRD